MFKISNEPMLLKMSSDAIFFAILLAFFSLNFYSLTSILSPLASSYALTPGRTTISRLPVTISTSILSSA